MRTSGIAIETARLQLRSLRDEDLAEMVALIGNWEVARWVSSVPHPYTETDGREWTRSSEKTMQAAVHGASQSQ